MTAAPQVDVAVHDHGRRNDRLVLQRIGCQHLEGITHLDDDDVFLLGGQVQLAVGAARRRLEAVGIGEPNLLVVETDFVTGGTIRVATKAGNVEGRSTLIAVAFPDTRGPGTVDPSVGSVLRTEWGYD